MHCPSGMAGWASEGQGRAGAVVRVVYLVVWF